LSFLPNRFVCMDTPVVCSIRPSTPRGEPPSSGSRQRRTRSQSRRSETSWPLHRETCQIEFQIERKFWRQEKHELKSLSASHDWRVKIVISIWGVIGTLTIARRSILCFYFGPRRSWHSEFTGNTARINACRPRPLRGLSLHQKEDPGRDCSQPGSGSAGCHRLRGALVRRPALRRLDSAPRQV
jgi:hypothetical protein